MSAAAVALAIALVADVEGFCAKPYQCPAKVWTIGFGTTRIDGRPVSAATPGISRETAHRLLAADMATRIEQVDSMLRVRLNANQKAALYSFAYNVGVTAFRDSTMLRHINAGRVELAGAEFSRWVYVSGCRSPGLEARRAAERALFEKPVDVRQELVYVPPL